MERRRSVGMFTKQRHAAEDQVSSGERLAAYAVTRTLSGHASTALPVGGSTAVQMRPIVERRSEPRVDASLVVCTSCPGEDGTVDGVTVNVSWSGVQLKMPT